MASTSVASLRIAAELGNLGAIRRFVEEEVTALGFDPTTVAGIVLAVDEAASNIIAYGYQGRGGEVEIEVRGEGNVLTVCLRDQAPPFDPTGVPSPDLEAPLEQRSVGGLGIHLIRQIVDSVAYRTTPQGGNELLLIKRVEENREDLDDGD